jgi:hypothetical protein
MITFNNIGNLGRLGNQLFQFSSVIGIADQLGLEAKFPLKNTTNFTAHTLHNGTTINQICEIQNCFNVPSELFVENIYFNNVATERSFSYDPRLLKIKDQTNIVGYLQTEKYFYRISEKIKSVLSFKDDILNSAKNLLLKFKDKELVSLHIRRGDYLALPNHHPVCNTEYIQNAIKQFSESSIFIICSDDLDWCRSFFKDKKRFVIINSGSSYIDLCVLSLCDHHIIANSSFSWWSSYLSNNIYKKIIAPKLWFGSKYLNLNTKDLYTSNMLII